MDLPVATRGMEAWVATVAKALSFGDQSKEEQLAAADRMQQSSLTFLKTQVSSGVPAATLPPSCFIIYWYAVLW